MTTIKASKIVLHCFFFWFVCHWGHSYSGGSRKFSHVRPLVKLPAEGSLMPVESWAELGNQCDLRHLITVARQLDRWGQAIPDRQGGELTASGQQTLDRHDRSLSINNNWQPHMNRNFFFFFSRTFLLQSGNMGKQQQKSLLAANALFMLYVILCEGFWLIVDNI